jgi:xylan 1,4-beta-xylosidase
MAGLMAGNRVRVESSGSVPLDDILKIGVRQEADLDALATAGDREAAVMLWNYHDDDMPGSSAQIDLSVKGFPSDAHRVLMQHYRIDDTHSNAYTVWKQMGSPQNPTPQQYAQLQAAGGLQLEDSPRWFDVNAGVVELNLSLPRQGISLVRFSWK